MPTNDNTRELLEYALSLGAKVELDPDTGKMTFISTSTKPTMNLGPNPSPNPPPPELTKPRPPHVTDQQENHADIIIADERKRQEQEQEQKQRQQKSKSKSKSKPLKRNPLDENGNPRSLQYSRDATEVYGKNALAKRAAARLLYADTQQTTYTVKTPALHVLDAYYRGSVDPAVLDVTAEYTIALAAEYRDKNQATLPTGGIIAALYSLVTNTTYNVTLASLPTTNGKRQRLFKAVRRARHQFLHDSTRNEDHGHDGNESYLWFVTVYDYLLDHFKDDKNKEQ